DKGRLKTSAGNLPPFNLDGLPNAGGPSPDLFLAGDIRANEQVGLTAMHTLFVREHNRLAARIAQVFPHANDEQVYQLARKIVGAELQIVTYNEFLPALLGPYAPSLSQYAGWDPEVNPSITNEFSTALFRVGHTMLSPNLRLADGKGAAGALPLRGAFFNPDILADNPQNVDYLLAGFTQQQAQEIDNFLVDDVRNFLFGPPGAGGLDLASLNIQRGRDHGLPTYNGLRMAYGLEPAKEFGDISSNAVVADALAAVYKSPSDVDSWVGALAEDHLPGASVGPLVAAGLVDQFTRLRDGDPFFHLNDLDLTHSRIRTIVDLRDLRLCQVIRWNTAINKLPSNVFFVEE
ncbi:MAG TPA: peroxidase family protein, partial [Pirellulaceae bacterium]|nr:peroxidase family protein [Pirellulaceae bacterium]